MLGIAEPTPFDQVPGSGPPLYSMRRVWGLVTHWTNRTGRLARKGMPVVDELGRYRGVVLQGPVAPGEIVQLLINGPGKVNLGFSVGPEAVGEAVASPLPSGDPLGTITAPTDPTDGLTPIWVDVPQRPSTAFEFLRNELQRKR